MPQDQLSKFRMQPTPPGYGNEATYTSTPFPVRNSYKPSSTPYNSMGYALAPARSTYAMQQQSQRSIISSSFLDNSAEAAQGRVRSGSGSNGSHGFPATRSTSSSVSPSRSYPPYLSGSIDSSVSDYANGGPDIESVSSRTLPRPQGFSIEVSLLRCRR
jgi:hypothetical protein